jgi:aspartate/methionine/tyrosine aminotransferase
MNSLAQELNALLDETAAGRLLSPLGRRLYFPRGIIAQSAEAKRVNHGINATIGMAYQDGKPLIMSAIADSLPSLGPEETVAYAPTAGVDQARIFWKDLLIKKNPSIDPLCISLPVVVPGITSGISYMADLFLDEGTPIIVSDPCWDNYEFIFHERRGAVSLGVSFFEGGPGLDLAAIRAAVQREAATGTVRVILNFPNNPSGYSPTRAEAESLIDLFHETAEAGTDVLVICDDAYFGLFYEPGAWKESLFGRLASLHERVLAVKIDGPTKEDYVWGFRIAFVTFGSRGFGPSHFEALIKKLMGIIRSSVSCANTPAQYLMMRVMADPRTARDKERYYQLLRRRYRAVQDFIAANPEHPALSPLPFNSGYFMSFRCTGIDPGELRRDLLYKQGIGTVVLGNRYVRIAFSAIDEDQIEGVFRSVYDTAAKLLVKNKSSESPLPVN